MARPSHSVTPSRGQQPAPIDADGFSEWLKHVADERRNALHRVEWVAGMIQAGVFGDLEGLDVENVDQFAAMAHELGDQLSGYGRFQRKRQRLDVPQHPDGEATNDSASHEVRYEYDGFNDVGPAQGVQSADASIAAQVDDAGHGLMEQPNLAYARYKMNRIAFPLTTGKPRMALLARALHLPILREISGLSYIHRIQPPEIHPARPIPSKPFKASGKVSTRSNLAGRVSKLANSSLTLNSSLTHNTIPNSNKASNRCTHRNIRVPLQRQITQEPVHLHTIEPPSKEAARERPNKRKQLVLALQDRRSQSGTNLGCTTTANNSNFLIAQTSTGTDITGRELGPFHQSVIHTFLQACLHTKLRVANITVLIMGARGINPLPPDLAKPTGFVPDEQFRPPFNSSQPGINSGQSQVPTNTSHQGATWGVPGAETTHITRHGSNSIANSHMQNNQTHPGERVRWNNSDEVQDIRPNSPNDMFQGNITQQPDENYYDPQPPSEQEQLEPITAMQKQRKKGPLLLGGC
ncbi:hypothetical protein NLG97_g2129 [Lecanicillium saksenae]|uniref:Uncharacterized protein n=1 Tax=Lecanicillium saksenae TaxID=468837 RepID=A0ACC1R3I6_9HYPO|nr:hypothetical protein NLG97_g2129 [Lecanicillium saksenae]